MATFHASDTSEAPYRTDDKTSFAYISARDRWPVILTGAIDDVHRAVAKCENEDQIKEGKAIVAEIAKLKYELQHDRIMSDIVDDGASDVAGYNAELEFLKHPSWFNAPWLFTECYLYRRLYTIFSTSKHWRSYDVFSRQKVSTFKSSRPAVLELAARYKELISKLESSKESDEAAEEVIFQEMCEICLWGNATDLSLLTSLSYEDIQKLQGANARKAAESNILVNDLPAVFSLLSKERQQRAKEERRVDIVLDNAGFELFVDLVLAGYLIAAGLATTIVLHPKSMPWFVSDVMPVDFMALLNVLRDPQSFYTSTSQEEAQSKGENTKPLSDTELDELSFMFEHWSSLHSEGQLIIRPNRFWTHAGSFWRLPKDEPSLLEDLQESELVIFKGDLNYRKLTGDAAWAPETPFTTAIGPLAKKSQLRVLALRTCKADVVVGLPSGVDKELRAKDGDDSVDGPRKWAWSGKWAVVQFSDGKK